MALVETVIGTFNDKPESRFLKKPTEENLLSDIKFVVSRNRPTPLNLAAQYIEVRRLSFIIKKTLDFFSHVSTNAVEKDIINRFNYFIQIANKSIFYFQVNVQMEFRQIQKNKQWIYQIKNHKDGFKSFNGK